MVIEDSMGGLRRCEQIFVTRRAFAKQHDITWMSPDPVGNELSSILSPGHVIEQRDISWMSSDFRVHCLTYFHVVLSSSSMT